MTQHYYQPYVTQTLPMFDPTAAALYYRGNDGAAVMDTHHQLALQYGFHPHHHESIQHLRELQQAALYHQQESGVMAGNNAQQLMSVLPTFVGLGCSTATNQIKSNKAQTKAQRRAEHNAIERLRRENLNNQFQQLANTLPNLENDRRPSKGTIIERTLDYVKFTTAMEVKLRSEIEDLCTEQEALRRQLEQDFSPALDSDDSSEGSFSPVESHQYRCSSSATGSCPSLELPSAALDFYSVDPLESMFAADDAAAAMYNSFEGVVDPFGVPHQMSYESDDDNYSSCTPDEMNFTTLPMTMTDTNNHSSAAQSIFGFPLYHQ